MAIELTSVELKELKPRITVMGVGGAGGNAVNNMIAAGIEGVSFVVANTDAQALANAATDARIQLGVQCTQGLGAGSKPDVGRAAAEEALDVIAEHLDGCHMLFLAAGMGGGTGTGASPVIARLAREKGILTVGVVTKPFHFEGRRRMEIAEEGIQALEEVVDTLIVIPNQNLFRIATEKTTFQDAFRIADDVLCSGVRGITDLMVMPGLINLDFADIKTVMSEMGKAMMGTGEATGERRAIEAAEAAIANPLLDEVSLKGAKGVIINITGGMDLTLFEVDEAANHIREQVDADANIIVGSAFNEALNGVMRVSVVATGIDAGVRRQAAAEDRRAEEEAQHAERMSAAGAGAAVVSLHAHAERPIGGAASADEAAGRAVNEQAGLRAEDPASESADPVQEDAPGFVAEEPVMPAEYVEPAGSGDPFAQAAYENAAPVGQEETAVSTRGPSLFERMTGLGRRRAEKRAGPPSSQAGAIGPDDRPLPARKGDDSQLEIPAFLRRQAN